MTVQLLRDLIEIPERVHAGDFVLTLSKGVGEDSTIRDYVVTEQLADCFDEALGLIQSAVEGRTSRAAYLDGSFGSGKSHFMAILHAILQNNPDARSKKGLVEVISKHDPWMADRKFLLVPYHMIEASSLESAVLGGYVTHVRKLHPEKPLPVVYRDEGLLADARDLRATIGDGKFLEDLPSDEDDEWGGPNWDSASLDAALAAPPGDPRRRQLVGDLLATHFKRYASAVSGTEDSFIELDKGLAEISRHAKDVLGYDVIVLLLDELVLWLSSYIGKPEKVQAEAQKVSKLVESAEHVRPAPIVSFVPRQRDLRELVGGRGLDGAKQAGLFDTLKYWDGRFDQIKLEDRNLPVIVEARLLRPKSDQARAAIDEAFNRTTASRSEVWEALIDAQGGSSDRASFRKTYPFSPAFLHAMVDISGALQRQRTALKLMQQLLVDYRDLLPVGQLMPMGSIYDVLASGQDRPFTDKLREEFTQAKNFYTNRLLPYLLAKHKLNEDQVRNLPARHAFRADDLVVKTLLLAALVPNVPALRNLNASRLAALNHGSIAAMLPGQERSAVARTLRELAGEFGEIRVTGTDDPSVEVALIGVDTKSILDQVIAVDDDSARRRLIKSMLWEEFGATEKGEFITTRPFLWKGTDRITELVFGNVRDRDALSEGMFVPDFTGAVRVVVDYPFDDNNQGPAEDRNRIWELQEKLNRPNTFAWLPSHLSQDRLIELGDLVRINHVLERKDRLDDLTPHLTADDRHHARTQLQSRQAALTSKLLEALKRAYGVASHDDADLGARADQHIMPLDSRLEIRPPAGLGLGDALQRMAGQMLDHAYPKHPDLDIQGKRKAFTKSELVTVLRAIEEAVQNKVTRLEVSKTDLAVLKRLANPLHLGTADEVFVLRDEWKQLIDRKAAQSGESVIDLRVGTIKNWVLDEQPGLPDLIVDLIVAGYAAQTDRAWIRAGQPIATPELGRLSSDMLLRRQELPTDAEFELANERAVSIFGLRKQPVCSARSVQALASGLREKAGPQLAIAETFVEKLQAHARTLGLDPDADRLVTAQVIADLLNQLSGVSDPTKLLRALAVADLPKEGPVYRASLDHAQGITAMLNLLKWEILDQLPTLAEGTGEQAEGAKTVLGELHSAARHNEQAFPLRPVLSSVEASAIQLILKKADPPGPAPKPMPPKPVPGAVTRRVRASEVAAAVEDLCEDADSHPGSTYEITWRIVES